MSKWTDKVQGSNLQFYKRLIEKENFIESVKKKEFSEYPLIFLDLVNLFYPNEKLNVLEIGAGPYSKFYSDSYKDRISITPTDPLADEYNLVIDSESGIKNHPCPTINMRAEDLLNNFDENSFEATCTTNSIDYIEDIKTAILNLLKLTKGGGIRFYRCSSRERRFSVFFGDVEFKT